VKAYLATTGSLFGLLAAAHLWRAVDAWPGLLHDTGELIEAGIGLLAAALCAWAWRLYRAEAHRAH